MKSNSSNSEPIDKRVILSMVVFAAIGLIILAFRLKDHEPCTTPEIAVKSNPVYVDELIQFKAITKNKNSRVKWDFGDKSQPVQDESVVSHIFRKPGRYEVVLNADKQCNTFKTIYVLASRQVEDVDTKPLFTGPRTVEAGAPAIFVDATPNAKEWEWRFGESNGVDATRSKVTYIYKTPGTKRVILIVNDKMQGEFMVLVTPRTFKQTRPIAPPKRPPIQTPDKSPAVPLFGSLEELEEHDAKKPDFSKEQIHMVLVGMVEGKNTADDLAAYFCDKQNMQVNFNDQQMSLDDLYKDLRKIKNDKKIKHLDISFEKEINPNCLKSLIVKLDRRRLL
jgi:hypothetical protein